MAALSNFVENNYRFTEVFVENEKTNKCIIETSIDEYLVINCRDLDLYNYKRFFGLAPYENILEHIDLARAESRRGFIIARLIDKDTYQGLLIESSTKLCIVEIKGFKLVVSVSESDEVSEGDRVAYIVTNKGEVRSFRSHCSGLVALVINITWEKPNKYILVVVDKNACRRINIRESKRNCI